MAALGQYKWRLVAYLWIICLLNYVDRSSIFALFPILIAEFSLSGTELGLIGSVFLWVYSISSPLAGALGDRFSRSAVVLVSLGIWSAITCLTGLAQSISQLLVCRGLMGLAEAAYFPAALAMISDHHGRDTRSTALSLHQSALYVGYMAGGAVAGLMAQTYGWRVPFYVFGGVGIIGVVVFSRRLREPSREKAGPVVGGSSSRPGVVDAVRQLARCRTALALAIVHFAVLSVAWIIFAWTPYFVHERFRLGVGEAALRSTMALQVPSVIGIIVGGLVADRLMRRSVRGRMTTLIAGLACGAPFLMLIGWGPSLGLALVGLGGLGFFKGFFDGNGPPAVHDVVRPASRGTAYGIFNAVGGISAGFGVLVVGTLKDRWGLGNLLASLTLLYSVSAAILAFASLKYLPLDVERVRALESADRSA